ncbi:MAG: SsgA family sporulation/cell division regulator [Propionibacteriales bacterium]|nr:SsgA family sporulation/cell division regulator [Propionibacteriales bacterium]
MNQNTTTVSTKAVQIATVDAEQDHDLSADFSFDPADPWAVAMTLATVTGPVTWTFARDLLIEGQFEPTGDGDVHVWPCLSPCGEAVVIVELDSPAGETLLQFPTRAIQDFVYASLETVPLGEEQTDIDSWLENLLGTDA